MITRRSTPDCPPGRRGGVRPAWLACAEASGNDACPAGRTLGARTGVSSTLADFPYARGHAQRLHTAVRHENGVGSSPSPNR
jgi:hypothetical protein